MNNKIENTLTTTLRALQENRLSDFVQDAIRVQYLINQDHSTNYQYAFDGSEVDKVNMLSLNQAVAGIIHNRLHTLKEKTPEALITLYNTINSAAFHAIISQLGSTVVERQIKDNSYVGGDAYGFLKILIQGSFHDMIFSVYHEMLVEQVTLYSDALAQSHNLMNLSILSNMIEVNGLADIINTREKTNNASEFHRTQAVIIDEKTETNAQRYIEQGIFKLNLLSAYKQFISLINKLYEWFSSFFIHHTEPTHSNIVIELPSQNKKSSTDSQQSSDQQINFMAFFKSFFTSCLNAIKTTVFSFNEQQTSLFSTINSKRNEDLDTMDSFFVCQP